MPKVGCITTFRHSINATLESNEIGRFSEQLGPAKLMSGCQIKNVSFFRNTEILRKENTWCI